MVARAALSREDGEQLLRHFYSRARRAAAQVGPPQDAQLARYLSRLEPTRRDLESWLLEAEWRRLRPAAEAISPGARLLDAGCGYGLHSCFFADLGAQVTGIDLDEERLAAARALAGGLGTQHAIFVARSIHRVLSDAIEPWDIVWANESISHIEPVPEFLSGVLAGLCSGGLFIISDHNRANPLIRLEARRERGQELFTTKRDPEGGAPLPYARERTYSVRELRQLLEGAGFRVRGYIPHGFVPPVVRGAPASRVLRSLEGVLRSTPAIRGLSGSYTLVATAR